MLNNIQQKMSTKSRKIREGAPALEMSARQKRLLTEYSKKRDIAHHHKSRLSILLQAAEGLSHNLIARTEETTVNRVKFWRKNWEIGKEALKRFEEGKLGNGVKDHEMLKEMLKRLEDAPRSGTPATISESQKAQIVGLACENPSDYGRPQTVWTYKLLKEVIIEKGILATLHERTVGKILKNAGVTTAQK